MRYPPSWFVPALLVPLLAADIACRDVLGVPVPAGVVDPASLTGVAGAEAQRQGAIAAFANAFDVEFSGLMSDEFTDFYLQNFGQTIIGLPDIDARNVAASALLGEAPGTYPLTDEVYTSLQRARINARLAIARLNQTAPPASGAAVASMYALVGYTELLLAEEFCSGVPIGSVMPGGGVQHGVPLTTDSLLGRATADLDSAVALGVSDDTVLNLARVGLGRALLDRGRFADAGAAVAPVPTGFQYVVELPATPQGTIHANFYSQLALPAQSQGGAFMSVADREGGNGLNFVSASDPRLPIDSGLGPTATGTPFYYPAKFPLGAPPVTLADGVEARLIQAEAVLQSGNVGDWATALNTLRADSADTHVGGLSVLTADSTTTASEAMRVDVMFRERAFWMFGTGHRLGDLRRIVRQYGRNAETVFPTGAYPATGLPPGSSVIASYGTDVVIPIQAVEQANPNFHGCLSRAP